MALPSTPRRAPRLRSRGRQPATAPRDHRRRLLAGVGQLLAWPTRTVWAGVGHLTRALSTLATGLWSLGKRAGRFADGPLAVALFAFVVLGPPGPPHGPPPAIDTLLMAAQLLPMAVLRRRPFGAWAVMATGNLLGLLVIDYYPVVGLAALIAAVAVVASTADRTTTTRTGALTSFALLPMLWHPTFNPVITVMWMVAVVAAMVFGDNLRLRREAEHDLAAVEEQRAQEQQRRTLLEERARIARELHDVVAHHMSLIAVQSQSAPRRIAGLPSEGVADFQEINTAARTALTEMRRVLEVLREEHGRPDRAPQPGVAALEDLVAAANQAGLDVTLRFDGEPRPLREALDLSVYRIVQEALTNVRRHADTNAADVIVRYLSGAVRVRVADRGVGDRSNGASGGHGLVGMRERVALLGGELTAGDRIGGGFVVTATLPYHDGSAT
jgi:signal transduction histidine kinase